MILTPEIINSQLAELLHHWQTTQVNKGVFLLFYLLFRRKYAKLLSVK